MIHHEKESLFFCVGDEGELKSNIFGVEVGYRYTGRGVDILFGEGNLIRPGMGGGKIDLHPEMIGLY